METLALGRSATDDADSVLEIAGTWLLFRVALHGPEARLAASPMDAAAAPETLLRSPDTAAGWQTIRKLIGTLETHGIRSLVRPIEAWDGYDGRERLCDRMNAASRNKKPKKPAAGRKQEAPPRAAKLSAPPARPYRPPPGNIDDERRWLDW